MKYLILFFLSIFEDMRVAGERAKAEKKGLFAKPYIQPKTWRRNHPGAWTK